MALRFGALISEFYKLKHPLTDGTICSKLGNQELWPSEWIEPLPEIGRRGKLAVNCQDLDSLSLGFLHAYDAVTQRSPDPFDGPQDLVLVSPQGEGLFLAVKALAE